MIRTLRGYVLSASLVLGAIFLVVCFQNCAPMGQGGRGANASSSSVPPIDNEFFLKDFMAKAIIDHIGDEEVMNLITTGAEIGAFKANAKVPFVLKIEVQRDAWDIMASAVSSNSASRADLGLKALEWSFRSDIVGADGSWPDEREGTPDDFHSLHPKSVFLFAAARALLILKASALEPEFTARITKLTADVKKSAEWLAANPETIGFFDNALLKQKQANQLLFVILALHSSGILTKSPSLIEAADILWQRMLAGRDEGGVVWGDRILSDGVFPEAQGFDASYQTVSLELLGLYYSSLNDKTKKDAILPYLSKGTDEFLKFVGSNGVVDTSTSTRTVACGSPVNPGVLEPKGVNVDIVPLRLRYLGLILDRSTEFNPLSEEINKVGIGFEHKEDCGMPL